MNVFRRGMLSSAVVCRASEGASATQAVKRSSIVLMAFALAATLASPKAAVADPSTYTFSFSGGGITSYGVFNLTPTGTANTDQITGISGYFSDTTAGFSGAITALEATTLPATPPPFVPPGHTATFSYDNLFYTDGNSPLVCPPDIPGGPPGYPFGGGVLDIYGVAFDVAGGYTVNLWSNGVVPGVGLDYEVSDALGATLLEPDNEGQAVPVTLSTAPTPEPGSLLLLTAGLPGLIAVVRRKMTRASV